MMKNTVFSSAKYDIYLIPFFRAFYKMESRFQESWGGSNEMSEMSRGDGL